MCSAGPEEGDRSGMNRPASKREQESQRVAELLEGSSAAVRSGDVFEGERLAIDALRRAHSMGAMRAMIEAIGPLWDSRRAKRDLAVNAGRVSLVFGDGIEGATSGCYLVQPPRVGIDGRALREMFDRAQIPALVVVREPMTRLGLWPLVSVGPVTVRTKVKPPEGDELLVDGDGVCEQASAAPGGVASLLPCAGWFVSAVEALGEAAARQVGEGDPLTRVDLLLERLEAHPESETLHRALIEACEAASSCEPRRRYDADSGVDAA